MPAAPATRRERHAVRTRQQIVDAALALFLEQGFEATTVDEIAARADVSPRTFFRYFPTKEALLFHDLDDRLAAVQQRIEARPADEAPAETLVEVLCEMVEAIESTPEERALTVRMIHERPALRAYQRSTIAEHAEREVTAALAVRAGLPSDDLGLRAMVTATAACLDLALRVWTDDGARGPFRATFLRVLDACAASFPRTRDASAG